MTEDKQIYRCDCHPKHSKWLADHDRNIGENEDGLRKVWIYFGNFVTKNTFFVLLTITITVSLAIAGTIHYKLDKIDDKVDAVDKRVVKIDAETRYLSKRIDEHMFRFYPNKKEKTYGTKNKDTYFQSFETINKLQNSHNQRFDNRSRDSLSVVQRR